MTWADVYRRISGYAKLPDNWDSYGSPKPTPEKIAKWLKITGELQMVGFPVPSAVSLASGTELAMTWQQGYAWCEMETGTDEGKWETGED